MNQLKVFTQVAKLESETKTPLLKLITKVPINNVLTAFGYIKMDDLVDMVKSVNVNKLVTGLTIINPSQIKNIPADKLKIILKHGDMKTVKRLQDSFSEFAIYKTINTLSNYELEKLLIENNYSVLESVINKLGK